MMMPVYVLLIVVSLMVGLGTSFPVKPAFYVIPLVALLADLVVGYFLGRKARAADLARQAEQMALMDKAKDALARINQIRATRDTPTLHEAVNQPRMRERPLSTQDLGEVKGTGLGTSPSDPVTVYPPKK
jgi:uncharacterized protein YneF (UPF0154 family)